MNKFDKDKVLVEFGLRIQQLRKEKKISQEKLAELAGLHRTYIGMIERGEKNITLKNIIKITNALAYNLSDFFKYEVNNVIPYQSL